MTTTPARLAETRRFGLVFVLALFSCKGSSAQTAAALVDPKPGKVVQVAYDGALQNGWLDYGWCDRKLGAGAAVLDLSDHAGWILARPGTSGQLGGVVFEVSAEPAKKMDVHLGGVGNFPRVWLKDLEPQSTDGGTSSWFIPMEKLNPGRSSFNELVFQGQHKGPLKGVRVDKVALTEPGKFAVRGEPARISLECGAPTTPVSPYIYGVGFQLGEDNERRATNVKATFRRWGGNTTTRYNPELGNAWGVGRDWFWRNADLGQGYSWRTFFSRQRALGLKTGLTVPTMGWVAKDTSSPSFPRSLYPQQQHFEGPNLEPGNGLSPSGKPLSPPPPTQTSVPFGPKELEKWVTDIRAWEGKERAVHLYFLDNEPTLWDQTHRDAHPEPPSYDELWQKMLGGARAIRKVDPEAIIAGPAEWGWTGYHYSGVDMRQGNTWTRPDRRKHGDVPLVAWLLQQARDHQKKTGERVLDVFDLHFYAMADGVGVAELGATDANASALRLRSTRGLWDPTYKDESWIKEPVQLIPRMKEWVKQYHPGLKLCLGEYSFGADHHPSGGLAQAEALGRFAQHGVDYAFLWIAPPLGSPQATGFKAYRDYDGAGARFLDSYVPSTASAPLSTFASTGGGTYVVVVLNLDPSAGVQPTLELPKTCGGLAVSRVFQSDRLMARLELVKLEGGALPALPPYSITVLELRAPASK